MDWTLSWTAIGAIATGVLAVGVVITLGLTWSQIRATRLSTNAQVAVVLFKELRNTETVAMLRSIYALKVDDFKRFSSEKWKGKDIDYVLIRFELLGALTLNKIIDEKLAIETFGGAPALKCWYKLYDYIREVQDKRGYCYENYELFVGRCLEYFKDKIQVKFYEHGKENEGINLVTELTNMQRSPRSKKVIEKQRKKAIKREIYGNSSIK
jgi:hypothetical protein